MSTAASALWPKGNGCVPFARPMAASLPYKQRMSVVDALYIAVLLTRSLRLSIPGLTSRYSCSSPLAAAVTDLSRLFLYSTRSPSMSSSIDQGCLRHTSLIALIPAAMTSLPTPGCTNSCASLRITGVIASGGVRSCTDCARATRMEGTRS